MRSVRGGRKLHALLYPGVMSPPEEDPVALVDGVLDVVDDVVGVSMGVVDVDDDGDDTSSYLSVPGSNQPKIRTLGKLDLAHA